MAAPARYARSVFINCPFDDDYVPIFEAIVFTIQALGFEPVSARTRINSGEVRLLKIARLIRTCRYSVHDLPRTDTATTLGWEQAYRTYTRLRGRRDRSKTNRHADDCARRNTLYGRCPTSFCDSPDGNI